MSNLERFVIIGLFNEYNVDLDLQKEVNIFVGENGMGKTTILNCLYSVLSGRVEELINTAFEEIRVFLRMKKSYNFNEKRFTCLHGRDIHSWRKKKTYSIRGDEKFFFRKRV